MHLIQDANNIKITYDNFDCLRIAGWTIYMVLSCQKTTYDNFDCLRIAG